MPLHSMTGYGAGAFVLGTTSYRVELRSVNHRHLDLKLRVSRELGPVEMKVRETLSAGLDRGHVDVNIGAQGGARPAPKLVVDEALAGRVHETLLGLREKLGIQEPIALSEVLRVDGVLSTSLPSYDANTLWAQVSRGVESALEDLQDSRSSEGARLAQDLEARLGSVAALTGEVVEAIGVEVAGYQERVRTRLAELLRREDPIWREQRLEAELALLAEKADIAEETTRAMATYRR